MSTKLSPAKRMPDLDSGYKNGLLRYRAHGSNFISDKSPTSTVTQNIQVAIRNRSWVMRSRVRSFYAARKFLHSSPLTHGPQ